MKKLIIPFFALICIYSIYYDLKVGTLPTTTLAAEQIVQQETVPIHPEIPSEKIVVEPGYTVLSIVEELHGGLVNATIQQIIYDFETLNPGTNASRIQIGKAYYFPVYRK